MCTCTPSMLRGTPLVVIVALVLLATVQAACQATATVDEGPAAAAAPPVPQAGEADAPCSTRPPLCP